MAFSFQALLSFHSVSHHNVMQQYVGETEQKYQCNINAAFLVGFAPFLDCVSSSHILIKIGSKFEEICDTCKKLLWNLFLFDVSVMSFNALQVFFETFSVSYWPSKS